MIFFTLTLLAFTYTIILGLRKKNASRQPKKYLRSILIIAILVSIISGISEGTMYSHGIDIPWWVFSLVTFVITLSTAMLLIVLIKIKSYFKYYTKST